MASSDPGPPPAPERPPRVHQRPSFTQVAASALAAVSAALISSTFGVAGTLIGTAIASVMASVGSTLYLASLHRTNDQLRRVAVAARRTDWSNALATRPSHQTPASEPPPVPTELSGDQREPAGWRRLRWSNLRAGLPTVRRAVGRRRRPLRGHLRRGDRGAHRDPGVDQPAPHGLPSELRLGACTSPPRRRKSPRRPGPSATPTTSPSPSRHSQHGPSASVAPTAAPSSPPVPRLPRPRVLPSGRRSRLVPAPQYSRNTARNNRGLPSRDGSGPGRRLLPGFVPWHRGGVGRRPTQPRGRGGVPRCRPADAADRAGRSARSRAAAGQLRGRAPAVGRRDQLFGGATRWRTCDVISSRSAAS